MKIETSETYKLHGKKVRILDKLDSKTFLVTDGKVFTAERKDLKKIEQAKK